MKQGIRKAIAVAGLTGSLVCAGYSAKQAFKNAADYQKEYPTLNKQEAQKLAGEGLMGWGWAAAGMLGMGAICAEGLDSKGGKPAEKKLVISPPDAPKP